MKYKTNLKPIFFFLPLLLVILAGFSVKENSKPRPAGTSWEKQLKEMNYLIIRISSVNVINGLFFTGKQADSLKKLSIEFAASGITKFDTTGNACPELLKVRRSYMILLEHLTKRLPINDSLKKQVNKSRVMEADIIRQSLLAAQQPGYSGSGCMQCHAQPSQFLKGDISKLETQKITPEKRAEIDNAHAAGLFGEQGMRSLWSMKAKADTLLTQGQKYIMMNFTCCLIPPDGLSDPTNIGQAFVSSDWINYFRSIRKLSDENWTKYKSLFVLPLDTLLKATLPGINAADISTRVAKAAGIIENARKLDNINYELQKQKLCLQLKDALNVTSLTGETERQAANRQFMSAMFLLFPGSDEVYDGIIKREGE